MKTLGIFNAMSELVSEIQILCGIRASVSCICLKLTHIPNILLVNIDEWIKNVLEDRAPHLLDKEREERNNMLKH